MQRVEIKVFGVATVQMDQHLLATDAADRGDPCPNAVKWGQVSGNSVERIDHEDMEVLIAIGVLQIEQMVPTVVGPAVELARSSGPFVGGCQGSGKGSWPLIEFLKLNRRQSAI